jgi:hypothetical protein
MEQVYVRSVDMPKSGIYQKPRFDVQPCGKKIWQFPLYLTTAVINHCKDRFLSNYAT